MRNVYLERKTYLPDRVLGFLTVKDENAIQLFRCATLELPWKANEDRVSCVPADIYPLLKEFSAHFKKDLWELKFVPGRDEAKIHSANVPTDLLGCIGVGMDHRDITKDGIMDIASSKLALMQFEQAMLGYRTSIIQIIGNGTDVLRPGMNGWKVAA